MEKNITKLVFAAGIFAALALLGASQVNATELSVSCAATPASSPASPIAIGQQVTYTATATGGTGPYYYVWFDACLDDTGTHNSCQNTFTSAGDFAAYVTVTDANEDAVTNSCTAYVRQPCTTHASKACYNGSVYWFDSCANREDVFQQCSANQTCNNTTKTCVSTCISHDHKACYDGDSYWYNSCNEREEKFQDCTDTCSNGTCVSAVDVTCYATPSTINAGQTVNFIATAVGGTGSFTYNWAGACSGSSRTCSTSLSQTGAQTASITATSGGVSDSATCSVTVNPNQPSCSDHSYKQCSGNNLYWHDSCNNRQEVYQYCTNGCYNNSCNSGYNTISVQTNQATNNYNSQSTLNGYLTVNGTSYCANYVWFQYGPTYSYGYETSHQAQNYSGAFSKIINLYSGSAYHFRAVAQDCQGNTVYGQDNTTNGSGYNGFNVTKTVRNLSSGSGWSTTTTANPGDVVMFMVNLQANSNQSANNIVVRDYLPSQLIYNNQLIVSGINSGYSGDIISGLNIYSINAGQTITITYQAKVASAANFSYGTTTLTNNVSVTSSNSSYNPTSNASVVVTRSGVLGASTISTGLTNSIFFDSFIIPLIITLLGLWMYRSGMFFGVESWVSNKKRAFRSHAASKELASRISKIQSLEK